MHLQVTTQGQPTLVAFVSLASEDPEEHRRQMARPFVFRNIHLRLPRGFRLLLCLCVIGLPNHITVEVLI